MPRARKPGSGGARQGEPGRAYANRTDLSGSYTGQQYGQATAQRQSMQAVPVAAPGGPSAPVPAPASTAPPPGSAGPFNRPTDRPGEPVTAGLPIGPGAGPEAMGMGDSTQEDLRTLAPYLPTLELLTSQPGSSVTTRNLVRRLRGATPPEASA